jgi:hypothetical protein
MGWKEFEITSKQEPEVEWFQVAFVDIFESHGKREGQLHGVQSLE